MDDKTALVAYLNEIDQIPGLDNEEEERLLVLVKEGDDQAKRHVIMSHLKETASIALAACPNGMRPLEAIQEANLVLVRFVEATDIRGLARPELRSAIRGYLARFS